MMKKILIVVSIMILILITVLLYDSYLGKKNLNLPCGFGNKSCQMTPLGNYYDLEEAKNWDCEKMPGIRNKVVGSNLKSFCLALKYDDSSYCDKIDSAIDDELSGFKKMICKAIVENNIDICKEITYDEFKQSKYYEGQLEKNRKYMEEGKLYKKLFSLDAEFIKYLIEGPVNDQFRNAFEKEGYQVSSDTIITHDPNKCGNCWFLNGKNTTFMISIDNSNSEGDHLDVNIYADEAYAIEYTENNMKSIYNQQVQSCFFQVGADNKNIDACNLVLAGHEKSICLREATTPAGFEKTKLKE